MTLAYVFAALDPPEPGGSAEGRVVGSHAGSMGTPHHGPSDETLVSSLRADDETAFDTVYRRYYSGLWRFAFGYVRSREIAEELVQDVFLSLWTRRKTLIVQTGLDAYLYAATRNRALRHRSNEVRAAQVSDAAMLAGESPAMGVRPRAADETVDVHEIQSIVAHAVALLPEARRTVLVLRWTRQMSYATIAAIMNTKEDAARMQVKRAERQLAELLQNAGVSMDLP
jgi:RNA polymerase sigma-70 factor (ECF subfamily)